jgi:hypothetical protein
MEEQIVPRGVAGNQIQRRRLAASPAIIMAGSLREAGYDAPQVWTILQSYGFGVSRATINNFFSTL